MLNNKKGFTLMEMLVTVLIIGILSAIAIPQYTTAVEKTKIMGNVVMMKALQDSVIQYYASTNEIPTSFKQLPVSLPQGPGGFVISGVTAQKADNSCVMALSSTSTEIGSGEGAYTATVPQALTMSCTTSGGNLNDWVLSFEFKPSSSGSVFSSGKFFKVQATDQDRAKLLQKVAKSSGWPEVGGNTYDLNPTIQMGGAAPQE